MQKELSQESAELLAQVLTAREVCERFEIAKITVNQACQRGWIAARKSGATWLMALADVEARWKRR